ncbi:MAG: hypothetical protein OEQ90_02030 [Gammaproteobacteria bacterium]|nr:hypothetical protein [Gammaproteobacteria bacterium]
MNKDSVKKTRLSLIACAASIALFGSSAAFAGEITGNGKVLTVNGKSMCAFSGQQDDPVEDAGFFKGDRVQNWGQIPKAFRDFLTSVGSNPGNACNPRKSSGGEP